MGGGAYGRWGVWEGWAVGERGCGVRGTAGRARGFGGRIRLLRGPRRWAAVPPAPQLGYRMPCCRARAALSRACGAVTRVRRCHARAALSRACGAVTVGNQGVGERARRRIRVGVGESVGLPNQGAQVLHAPNLDCEHRRGECERADGGARWHGGDEAGERGA